MGSTSTPWVVERWASKSCPRKRPQQRGLAGGAFADQQQLGFVAHDRGVVQPRQVGAHCSRALSGDFRRRRAQGVVAQSRVRLRFDQSRQRNAAGWSVDCWTARGTAGWRVGPVPAAGWSVDCWTELRDSAGWRVGPVPAARWSVDCWTARGTAGWRVGPVPAARWSVDCWTD